MVSGLIKINVYVIYQVLVIYSHSLWPDAGQYEYSSKPNEVYHTREDHYDVNGNNSTVGKLLPFTTLRETEVILNVEAITTLHSGSCSISSISNAATTSTVVIYCSVSGR